MRIERALRLADDLRERTSERASETNESEDDCARMTIDIEREEPLNMMMMYATIKINYANRTSSTTPRG